MYLWYVRHRYMNGAILSLSLLALLSTLIYPFYIDINSAQVVILISSSVITTILLLMNTKYIIIGNGYRYYIYYPPQGE